MVRWHWEKVPRVLKVAGIKIFSVSHSSGSWCDIQQLLRCNFPPDFSYTSSDGSGSCGEQLSKEMS